MIQILFIFSDWALFALRVIVGVVMVYHGLPKLRDIKSASELFSSMKIRPPVFWAAVVAAAEFFGGLFLLVGFLTQAVSIILLVQFLVILVWIKRFKSFREYELDLLLFGALLVLAFIGGGAVSADGFFRIFL